MFHPMHSFRLFRLFKSTTTQRSSRHCTDTAPEFHAEAPQTTVNEGLAQGSYVAARAGFAPTTLRTKGNEPTNEPTHWHCISIWNTYKIHHCPPLSPVVFWHFPLTTSTCPA